MIGDTLKDNFMQYNTTHMEYTITIDDSVGFNEFYDKYEVISVDGEKYRVIER